ncbi:MAG: hypothetical protein HON00_05460, partial [Flavobacteriaceae bacterium]|nr:hypothetical protein [Flavobacteriaceae bacterium]
MKLRFLLLSIFITLSCSSKSDSYYFDSDIGSDSNHGTSIESPFKTLKKLKTIFLNSGDSIFLSNGSYFKGNIKIISLDKIYISNYNIKDENNSNPIIDSKGHIAGIYIEDSSNISISNILITANGGGVIEQYPNLKTKRSVDKAIMRAGVLVNVSSNKTFKNISINNVTVKDLFYEDKDFVRDSNEVKTSMGTQAYGFGIRFYNSSKAGFIDGISVTNCYVENVGHTGIKMTSNGSK